MLPRIELLGAAADALDGDDPAALAAVDDGVSFLHEQLIPHAKAEDVVLYPEVERVTGAPRAAATMRREHVEVERLTAHPGPPPTWRPVRRHLDDVLVQSRQVPLGRGASGRESCGGRR